MSLAPRLQGVGSMVSLPQLSRPRAQTGYTVVENDVLLKIWRKMAWCLTVACWRDACGCKPVWIWLQQRSQDGAGTENIAV
jgi:hypothetical protein